MNSLLGNSKEKSICGVIKLLMNISQNYQIVLGKKTQSYNFFSIFFMWYFRVPFTPNLP